MVLDWSHLITSAAKEVIASSDDLTQLDSVAGDGDLGITMKRGMTAVIDNLREVPTSGAGAIGKAGRTLLTEAPSTMGTLLGAGFEHAARTVIDTDDAGAQIVSFLAAVTSEISMLGNAKLGDRSALDAMIPSAEAVSNAYTQGTTSFLDLLVLAETAARTGAQATANMMPKTGRARWTRQDLSKNLPDGGAVAWATFITGLLTGARSLATS